MNYTIIIIVALVSIVAIVAIVFGKSPKFGLGKLNFETKSDKTDNDNE